MKAFGIASLYCMTAFTQWLLFDNDLVQLHADSRSQTQSKLVLMRMHAGSKRVQLNQSASDFAQETQDW